MMKGFTVVSWIVTIVCLACIPSAIRDSGMFGLFVILLAILMPLGSAIAGTIYWNAPDSEEKAKKILHF